jgi:hypothetical protein
MSMSQKRKVKELEEQVEAIEEKIEEMEKASPGGRP